MDKHNSKKSSKFQQKFYANHHHSVKEHVHIIQPVKKDEKLSKISDDWRLYLPDESYDKFAYFNGKLKAVESYFSEINDASLISFSQCSYFRVNVAGLLKNERFLADWPEFMDNLINTPKIVIGLFGFTMHQLIKNKQISEDEDISDPTEESEIIPQKLNPRFVGLKNYLNFQDLKMHNYGKFVTVIGTVVRVSDVKPFCLCIAFMCIKCQEVQVALQNKGCYTTPNICTRSRCLSKVFKPLFSSHLTQTVPLKNISLQEINREDNDGGHISRTIECELTCELTNSCLPGDTVIISGIVSTSNRDERKEIGKDVMSYILHISANSVVCLKGKNVDTVDLTSGYLEIKSEDLGAIQHIHSEPNLFRLVVSSLAPNIYGHDLIKAGLVLGLFGGRDRTKQSTVKREFHIRENSHILIVGDPGLGKSQMLLACANVSPRGVYVCGNSTTSSGLTVTISKGGSENSLEAGALVLADQGHCCIDEFDKMMHQHSALLEAMEQQTISMAKSGVVCTLPARTSILAAANPSGGHYNRAKTVSENLRIGGSLLSRFDLVFIVQDEPNQDLDNKMSKHVMGLHTLRRPETEESSISHYFSTENNFHHNNNLLRNLKFKPNEKPNFIPPALLQKYISYARKFSQPKITPEVAKILQEFYLDMRKQHKLSYSTPITTRQLESLIRLTEARARVELRAYCTKADAEDVIDIMKYSMKETYSDDLGNIDFDRSIHGSGMSKSAQAKKLVNLMTKMATTKGDDCFTSAEIKELSLKLKIPSESFYAVIDTLNNQGFILKKGHQLYQLQTL